jgi:glucans biosynthesis protein C
MAHGAHVDPSVERRYYGLDALRGGMMMLGIVLHGADFYMASPPPTFPFPTDRNNSLLFDFLFDFIHSFRMPTFFVLAGFFASLLVDKRGLWGTWKNRASRILAPFLAALVLILPPTMLFYLDFVLAARFGTHELLPQKAQLEVLAAELAAAGHKPGEPSPAHLWFLYYLLYFYLLIPLCQALVGRLRPRAARVNAFLAAPATLLPLALCTAAALWPYRGGQVLEGFIYFRPHLPSLVYYGSFFVLGYLFNHFQDVLRTFARHVAWYAALALVVFPLALYATHLDYAASGQAPAAHLAAVLLHGLCTWSLVAFFIGSAMRFFDRGAPWILYASQSSYWVYLVHMPLLCLAGWWLVQYDLPALVKFLLAAGFTTVVCFATYHYWVQRTWISGFLNGRRFDLDWPWRAGTRAPA